VHADSCGSKGAVAGDERAVHGFGESHADRVIGRQIVAELPNPGQGHNIGMAVDREVRQVSEILSAPVRREVFTPDVVPQRLCGLHVEEVRRVNGFAMARLMPKIFAQKRAARL